MDKGKWNILKGKSQISEVILLKNAMFCFPSLPTDWELEII